MSNQTEWTERAANNSKECWKSFISSRVELALERISRNPDYKEIKKNQEKGEEEVGRLLEKLNKDERRIVQRHYEGETTVVNYELEETYLQGVRDGIRFLMWMDIFQVKGLV